MNKIWQALAREAALAAEHLAIGATIIGKANYAETAYYGQAFFALATGFERAAKLSLVIDHALKNNGQFPTSKVLRDYGHNLSALLTKVDEIAAQRQLRRRLPNSEIHNSIIKLLTDFANNVTRYYNLDLVTGNPITEKQIDPVSAWFDQVVVPILRKHQTKRQKNKIQQNARLIDELIGCHAMVMHHSESGDELNTVYDASFQTGITEAAKPYVRMYVMQIVRFMGHVLSELGYAAYGTDMDTIPHLSEFFAIFNNNDQYFKSRRTWSIYRP